MADRSPARLSARLARAHVDVDAIVENWRRFSALAANAGCAAVVKADAYGLGADAAVTALAKAGARTFFTATKGEALEVRAALGEGPQVFVLNGPSETDVSAYLSARLIPVLNSHHQIALWDGRGPAALHIDTGMNRLGVGPEELATAAEALRDASLVLVMSHLACASDIRHPMNVAQRERFVEAAKAFPPAPLSLASTAGALIGPDFHFDLIRPGLGLYGSCGLDDGSVGENIPSLRAAVTIEAPILQVRQVAEGESFGYGATVKAEKPMRTATVALGYADGFLRSLSGRGYGVLAGRKLPLLGRVSMDLVILDASDCGAAQPGVSVEFLGPNVPVDEVAALAGTAAYEILTGFAGTVRRGEMRG